MKRRIVALSGGMDSTTLLAAAIERQHAEAVAEQGVTNPEIPSDGILCVSFDYGSKHAHYELFSAMAVANHYRVAKMLVDLRTVMKTGYTSALLNTGANKFTEIPEGFYEGENMRQTVVPGRNLLMLSIMAGLAESQKIDEIWIGAHSGDHHIYPDCRPDFIGAAASAIFFSSDGKVQVQCPFLQMNKTSIIEWGLKNKVPYELTRTCYKDQGIACGKCGSCQERLDAFAANNIADPIAYSSRELIPKPVAKFDEHIKDTLTDAEKKQEAIAAAEYAADEDRKS